MYQTVRRRAGTYQHRGCAMGWKATGQPTVRQQRDKWVVRVDGIDRGCGVGEREERAVATDDPDRR